LTGKDGAALKGFGIAGSNGNFVFGDAVIQGNVVSVSSPTVSAPTQVYYGYATNPIGNLYNKEGLPASPFLTTSPDLEVPTAAAEGRPMIVMASPARRNMVSQGFWVNARGCKMGVQSLSAASVLWYKVNENENGRIYFKGNRFFKETDSR
jgi:hypothetical protein